MSYYNNLLSQCYDIEYATPLLECTSTAGYSVTTGECTCAQGYSGTVTYRNGVLGGCTAIPCTTAGYSGTAGACTCAYSGTVTYTNGVLGGCTQAYSYSYTLTLPTSVKVNSLYTYPAIKLNNASDMTISYLQFEAPIAFISCSPEISFNSENKFSYAVLSSNNNTLTQYISNQSNPDTKFIKANSTLSIRIIAYTTNYLNILKSAVNLKITYG